LQHTPLSSGSSAITVSNFPFAERNLFSFFTPFKSDLWGSGWSRSGARIKPLSSASRIWTSADGLV
jgi:hypothetical protein